MITPGGKTYRMGYHSHQNPKIPRKIPLPTETKSRVERLKAKVEPLLT